MNDKTNEIESLSRLREIIFGEQVAKIEEEIKKLSSDNKTANEKITEELKELIDSKTEMIKELIDKQKLEFEEKIKQVELSKADNKVVADALRKLANTLDADIEHK